MQGAQDDDLCQISLAYLQKGWAPVPSEIRYMSQLNDTEKTALKEVKNLLHPSGDACKCVLRPAFCQRAGRSRLIQP